ncbi:MAG: hypothetical protein WC481_03655 [Candidatus Omnitrophota bacterium]
MTTRIFMAVFIVFCVVASTRADTVVLQNGRTLEGRILEQTDDYIEIKLGSGKMKLGKKDIKSFEIKEPAEGYSTVELPDIEVMPEEAAVRKPVAADIKLKAEYTKGKVFVSGTSSYPNNTPLRVYFMQGESVVMVKESRVKRGEFYIAFGPFEKEIMAGKYSVRAEATIDGSKAYSEPFALVIGSGERVKVDETREKQYLQDKAQEVSELYAELNRAYDNAKASYDGRKWKGWSKGWLEKVNSAAAEFNDDSRKYIASVRPVSQRRLQFCFHQLPLLLRAYTIEFNSKSAKSPGQVLPVQDAQALRQSFDRALSETVQDVSAVAVDLNHTR